MQGRLAKTYRVARELVQNASFSGTLRISDMPRLSTLVIPGDEAIDVRFEFTSTALQHPAIRGHYRAQLIAQCQRCLEPVDFVVDQDFELLIDATDEDIEALQVDTVYSSDGILDVFEVIEDELILALPIIVMHDDTSCNDYLRNHAADTASAETNSPFAVLSALRKE